jgi:hypothetical protein
MPSDNLLREVGERRNSLGYKEVIELKCPYLVNGATLLMWLPQLGVTPGDSGVVCDISVARCNPGGRERSSGLGGLRWSPPRLTTLS